MLFASLSIFGVTFAGLSFAQTTTFSLFVPGADTQPLIGAVIGSEVSALTYAIRCIDSETCGFPGGLTLTEGPSTAAYTISEGAEFTGVVGCSLAGTLSAVCIESNGGNAANDPGSSTVTLTGTDYTYMPVTIVSADAFTTTNDSLSTPTGSGTANTSNTGITNSGSIVTGSVAPTTTSSMASGSGNVASQSGSTTTSSSHAGGPAITGNAMLVVGGVAVAMAVLG